MPSERKPTTDVVRDIFRNVYSTYSQRARVRFWLWITKVSGPTKTLHILNAEVVLITVWGAVYLYLWEIYGLS